MPLMRRVKNMDRLRRFWLPNEKGERKEAIIS